MTDHRLDFLSFVHERQRVYLDREAGKPYPWTDDPVLRNYRLENIYREQDRETVWLREHWRGPYAEHPNLWFACAMFRLINWSPTLAEVGFSERWEPERVLQVMESRRARGAKVYTSAYRLPQHGEKIKAQETVYNVLDPLWRAVEGGKRPPWEEPGPVSLEAAHHWLGQFYGFGLKPGFLTYEVVTDLRWTRYLRDAADIYTWGNVGPGAQRGLNLVLGLDVATRMSALSRERHLLAVFEWMEKNRDPRLLPTLEPRDVEHALCAYAKYCRARESIRAGKPPGLECFVPPRRNLFGEVACAYSLG